MNATLTPAPVNPSERAVCALGSLESAWIALRACGSSSGWFEFEEQVVGTGDRPVAAVPVLGVSASGASLMIWSGTTSATAGLDVSCDASPEETVAATALMVV
jgi:hypothetical protein